MCCVAGNDREAARIASAVRADIRRETQLNASVGVGHNVMQARQLTLKEAPTVLIVGQDSLFVGQTKQTSRVECDR
jgi:hypothetical protein